METVQPITAVTLPALIKAYCQRALIGREQGDLSHDHRQLDSNALLWPITAGHSHDRHCSGRCHYEGVRSILPGEIIFLLKSTVCFVDSHQVPTLNSRHSRITDNKLIMTLCKDFNLYTPGMESQSL